ncbi:DUF4350 domain-containing protein [Rapidithrix thailandica]|uniref:DUF4350 domain-containing protein n=1 Tax=Rapidithrix thailandica TaxID=413964 RepID=A0AAW9SD24_9BACT
MQKKDRKFLYILGFSFLLLFGVEYTAPKPLDWSRTFSKNDKIPYGNYLLYNLLQSIFPDMPIHTLNTSLYQLLNESSLDEALWESNFILINDQFQPDATDLGKMLALAEEGSNFFIASHTFSEKFQDTLQLGAMNMLPFWRMRPQQGDTTHHTGANFVNPQLRTEPFYPFRENEIFFNFSSFDTLRTTVLGQNSMGDINYIKVEYGKGNFYLHANPLIFTNYNMVKADNQEYITKALSYLPLRPTYWDEYHNKGYQMAKTPLRFVLMQPSLKWAYYLTFFTLIVFVIFRGKRKQKIIPIHKPHPNTTLQFVGTIGRLYFQHKDHKNLALKKITYFKEFLRSRYYLNTQQLDEHFIRQLVSKSGKKEEEVRRLFQLIDQISSQGQISEATLLELNDRMEKFYQ